MKKGLTIALLMVALVAMVASASAVAPTIQNLPSVIIGDVGDVSGVGTSALHLLRYENVFNLNATGVVDRHATSTAALADTTNLSWYYMTTGTTTLRASNATALKAALTSAEATNLQATGAVPPAAKKINSTTDLWLSLIHDAGSTTPASAKLATAAANGNTTTALAAAGATGRAVVSLFCTDQPVVEPNKTGTGSFVVYSIAGAADDYSPVIGVVDLNSAELGTTPAHSGFQYFPPTGADQVPPTKLETANGFGFTGTASTLSGATQAFASWSNGLEASHASWVPALNSTGKVIRAQFTLTGTATSPILTPGYRILFTSANFVHLGGYAVTATAVTPGAGINYPSAGSPVNTRLYWAAPITLINHWADGGKAAVYSAPTDERDYILYFDCLQTETGDTGSIVLESLVIDKIVRPPDAVPTVEWGGTGLAFSSWAKTTGPGGGFQPGVATINAANCTLAMATGQTTLFQQINADIATPAAMNLLPVWTSGKLIRYNVTAAATSMDLCPQIRVLAIGVTDAGASFGNTLWGVTYNPAPARAKNPSGAAAAGLIGALKTTATVYETYVYTQNGPVQTARIVPIIDILDGGGTIGGGWARPTGTVTVSGVKMEVLN